MDFGTVFILTLTILLASCGWFAIGMGMRKD